MNQFNILCFDKKQMERVRQKLIYHKIEHTYKGLEITVTAKLESFIDFCEDADVYKIKKTKIKKGKTTPMRNIKLTIQSKNAEIID